MITNISDFLKNYREEYKAPPKKIICGGGIELKEGHRINVLAGLPGTGKTSYLLKISGELTQKSFTVIFFSFEMNSQQLAERIISQHTQIKLDLIQSKRIEPQALIEQVQRHINFNIYICHAFTEKELIEDINSIKADRMFFVWDYLQKMNIKKGVDDISKINRNLDFICKTNNNYDAQSFIASSLNRGGYEKNTLDVFKGTGDIEFAADMAILMRLAKKNDKGEWEGLNNGELDIERKNINVNVLFNTLKDRHGQESSFTMQFKKDTQSFCEIENGTGEGEGEEQTETKKQSGRPRTKWMKEQEDQNELY